MPTKWEFPSGFLKEHESCEEAVLRELKEETSLIGTIERIGAPKVFIEDDTRWIVVPFLLRVGTRIVHRNECEHQEFVWISTGTVDNFDLVIGTKEVMGEVVMGEG